MRAVSLGSGSKGNCTLISSASTSILIDAGFGVRDTESRLAKHQVSPDSIQAIFVTHEHGDHAQGEGRLQRAWNVPVYASHGTATGARLEQFSPLRDGQPLRVGDIEVTPVLVPHDAREPTQFVFQSGEIRIGICTDLGSVSPHVVRQFQDLDGLLLEANYDPQMLAQGPYPPKLKARVGCDHGHLSNQQGLALLQQLLSPRLKTLVACHLSEKNNTPAHVQSLWAPHVPQGTTFHIASQTDGCAWIDLTELAHG